MVEFQTLLSVAVPAATGALFWNQLRIAARATKLPEAEKNSFILKAGLIMAGWFLLALVLALLDSYHVTPSLISPGVPLGFLLPVALGMHWMRTSKTFQAVLDKLSQKWLVLLQVPRLLGFVFLQLYLAGQLPALFALPSGVGDLLIGFSAPVVAYFYVQKKSWAGGLAKIWNYVGILDLVVAIGMGVLLVLPKPFQIVATTPSTEIMTTFPLALIPVFAVPLGLLMHLFSLRLLAKQGV